MEKQIIVENVKAMKPLIMLIRYALDSVKLIKSRMEINVNV